MDEREASAVVEVISCQCLRKMNQNAHLGVAGVIGGVDGEDAAANGRDRGKRLEPVFNWAGRGIKNGVATPKDPVAGVAGDTEGVGTKGRGSG